MFSNKKKSLTLTLFGLLFCIENAYSSMLEEVSVSMEKEKSLASSPSKEGEERNKESDFLSKIRNLPKESLEKQSNMEDSIAIGAYRNDRYWINKEGHIILLESH